MLVVEACDFEKMNDMKGEPENNEGQDECGAHQSYPVVY